MEQKDPSELVREVQEEQRRRGDIASEALGWFLDGRVGTFYPRQEAVEELSESLSISQTAADTAIADTVGDVVDPVQQIVRAGDRYVGVIDYRVYEGEGAYGYVDFDDRKGKRNRVVCARCVEKYDYDEQIRHATQGEGSVPPAASWQDLLDAVTSHYADSHAHPPSDIEPGASLVSGTTIGGNTAFHTGNLADRGAVTITPSTTNQTIPEGFHNGNGFVGGDADLIPDNIRDGVNIFGVTGNIDAAPDNRLIHGGTDLVARNVMTGDEVYTISSANATTDINSNGSLFVYGSENNIHVHSVETGDELSYSPLTDPANNIRQVFIDNTGLISAAVPSGGGKTYFYDSSDGSQKSFSPIGTSSPNSVCSNNDYILTKTDSGGLPSFPIMQFRDRSSPNTVEFSPNVGGGSNFEGFGINGGYSFAPTDTGNMYFWDISTQPDGGSSEETSLETLSNVYGFDSTPDTIIHASSWQTDGDTPDSGVVIKNFTNLSSGNYVMRFEDNTDVDSFGDQSTGSATIIPDALAYTTNNAGDIRVRDSFGAEFSYSPVIGPYANLVSLA